MSYLEHTVLSDEVDLEILTFCRSLDRSLSKCRDCGKRIDTKCGRQDGSINNDNLAVDVFALAFEELTELVYRPVDASTVAADGGSAHDMHCNLQSN